MGFSPSSERRQPLTMALDAVFWRGTGRVAFGQTRDDAGVEHFLARRHGRVARAQVITSGGCTAFRLMDCVAGEILSIDINPAQNAVATLKIAAWKNMPHGAFQDLLGADGRTAYRSLRAGLPGGLREFWDRRQRTLRHGLLHSGNVDAFLRLMRAFFYAFVHRKAFVEKFLSLENTDQQKMLYESSWNTWRWRAALRIGFHPALLRLSFNRRAAALLPADFSGFLSAKIRAWLTTHPARGNLFLWQTLLGRCPPGHPPCPQPEEFATRRELLHKITLRDGDAVGILRKEPSGSLDFFSLSNILELASSERVSETLAAVTHAAAPGALLVIRSILEHRPPPNREWTSDDALLREARSMDRGGICLPVAVWRRG